MESLTTTLSRLLGCWQVLSRELASPRVLRVLTFCDRPAAPGVGGGPRPRRGGALGTGWGRSSPFLLSLLFLLSLTTCSQKTNYTVNASPL